MAKKRIVSDEAKSTLVRVATLIDAVPKTSKPTIQKILAITFAENTEGDPLDVVQAFTNCVFNGITPPPNLLVQVAEKFSKYLDSGDISLDYAFDLQKKQRSGHPISQRTDKLKRLRLLCCMRYERVIAKNNGRELSIRKATEIVINKYCGPDYPFEALLKDYSAMEIDKIFNASDEAVREYKESLDEQDVNVAITEIEDALKK